MYPFEQSKLNYEFDALEPFIDAQTMEIHYTKHHAGYVAKLNEALKEEKDFHQKTIEQILEDVDELPEHLQTVVRKMGGGHVNHELFWKIMAPADSVNDLVEDSLLLEAINRQWNSFEDFVDLFSKNAMSRFGSGWAWLVVDDGQLAMPDTPNQDSPWLDHHMPILGIDVWEHAYYLKYQNRRAEYIENWWNVVNWEEVERRYLEYVA